MADTVRKETNVEKTKGKRFEFYAINGFVYVTDKDKVVSKVKVPDGAIDCSVDDTGAVHFRFD
ncbi:MAG: hypothetical protein IKE91_03060 [Clostridia bacterium]|nr:hypothetical protein [Clostridia bacterium]